MRFGSDKNMGKGLGQRQIVSKSWVRIRSLRETLGDK